MMHAVSVPAVAGRFENWTMTDLDFSVTARRQFENLESPDATAVTRHAVLREAKEFVVELQDATGGTRAALVVSDEWAARMFEPWTKQLRRGVKMKRVVLVRRGTGKQPPAIGVMDNRWVGEATTDQTRVAGPASGKFIGFIERDRAGVDGFREHVILVFTFENVRIGEVIRFAEDDLFVGP